MLDPDVLEAIAEVCDDVEQRLLGLVQQDRVAYEEDWTSRLSHDLEMTAERELEGIRVQLTVVPSAGPGSTEKRLGADLVGVVRIEIGDMRVSKGFLAQAKRAGSQGVDLVSAPSPDIDDDQGYSHWLWRGGLHLDPSGTVTVTKPSADLEEQCDNMLRRTPSSFVFVYHPDQIGVVSASAVHSMRSAESGSKTPVPIGTKRLSDFLVHVADSFLGDRSISAGDLTAVRALAARENAAAAMFLAVTPAQR